jgi:type II secretory pathway pseudopilin PulG
MKDGTQQTEAGFSIIEMLVAIVVVTFGLVSVVGISVYVSRANSTSNALNVLAASAQDQTDRLRTAQWTATVESPMLAAGGSLAAAPMSIPSGSQPYTYILDPNNPHHAVVANTPAGDLDICWQVRQGDTPDLRYVTIKVVQINPQPNMTDGFTITTMIVRS